MIVETQMTKDTAFQKLLDFILQKGRGNFPVFIKCSEVGEVLNIPSRSVSKLFPMLEENGYTRDLFGTDKNGTTWRIGKGR